MPSFFIPLSGLNAASNALNVISNNLANLNTIGYKDQTVNFKDLFYQSVGSTGAGSPIQIGTGTGIGSISSNFTQGPPTTPTGVWNNAAIVGDGFFVVQQPDGALSYTRAGNFIVSDSGQLLTQNGESVMGFPAVGGKISTTQGLSPIIINKGQTIPGQATTSLQFPANLDAGAANGTIFNSPVTVFDSMGEKHELNVQWTKTAQNTWDYKVTIPGGDVGQPATPPPSVGNGTVTFDQNGNLNPPAIPPTLTIAGLTDGANNMTIKWNLVDPATGASTISQQALDSSNGTVVQDGFASGILAGEQIDADGTIEGQFTNGKNLALGQIAVATFNNLDGLKLQGNNEYSSTIASGEAAIGVPGTGSRGAVLGGVLEGSNVDIATEFSNMIVTQRGYQANTRVITAFDEVTQDTINIIR